MPSWRHRSSYVPEDAPVDAEGVQNPYWFEQADASEILGAPPAEVMERLGLDQSSYDGMMQEVSTMQRAIDKRSGSSLEEKPLNVRVGSMWGRSVMISPKRGGRKAPRVAERQAEKRLFGGFDASELDAN